MKKLRGDRRLILAIIIIGIWIISTNVVQRVKCNGISQNELFIHLPKTIILNFKNCE